jgi:hypothetical protein
MARVSKTRIVSYFTIVWVLATLMGLFAPAAQAQTGDTKMLLPGSGTEVSYNSPHLPGCDFDIQWTGFAANTTLTYTFSSQSPTLGGTFITNTVTTDNNGFAKTFVSFNAGNLAGVTPQPNQNYHITLVGDVAGGSTKGKTFWLERACGGLPPPTDECPNIDGDQAAVPDGLILDTDGNCVPPYDACPNIDGVQDTVPAGLITNDAGECVPPVDVCPNLQGAQDAVPDGYTLVDGECVGPDPVDVCPNLDGDQSAVPVGYEVDESGNCVEPTVRDDDCPNLQGKQQDLPDGYVFDADGNCVKPEDRVLGETFDNANPDKPKPEVKAEDAKPDERKILPFTGSEPAPLVALGSMLLMTGLGFLFLQRKSDQLDF